MASISKEGKRWRAQITVKGYKRLVKRFDRQRDANIWAMDTEREMRAAASGEPARGTIGDVMRRYAEEVTPTKRGERWERLRLEKIARDPIANVPLALTNPDDLIDWRDRALKKISPPSVAREMNLLMAMMRHAVNEWRMLPAYPWEGVKRPRPNKPRKRRISDKELDLLCETVDMARGAERTELAAQRIVMLAMIAVETGMRLGELCSVQVCDIDLKARVVHLELTKNGDERDVPLSTEASRLFGLLCEGLSDSQKVAGMNSGTASTLFRRVRDMAGITDLHFHDTRHEACTRLARKIDVLDLARIIGHRDINSLMIYYNPTAAEIAQRLD